MVRMSSIIMPSIVGDRGSHAGCRQKKCDVFCPFVCFLSLSNYKVSDNGM